MAQQRARQAPRGGRAGGRAQGGRAGASRPPEQRPATAARDREAHPSAPSPEPPTDGIGILSLPPAVARMTLVASARAALWTGGVTWATTRRVVRAARDREPLGEVLSSVQDDAVRSARTLLGVDALEEMLGRSDDRAPARAGRAPGEEPEAGDGEDEASNPARLRERGRELLLRSAEIEAEPGTHPAFAAVLDQISPDEARILRLLCKDGPQPLLDVFATGPLGIGSRQVARGLSMVGQNAGCQHQELVPFYVGNLERLGLLRRGADPLEDDDQYQVLEAQPEVSDAEEQASRGPNRARVEKLSLELSEFGQRFCAVCLPGDDG
jgi:hypothetical protein